ncbi:hypothetical protein HPB52_011737 [Rhipicephalus sanguineus]|uniref:CCHC-type domain-containing protein n=1 Tax=Rhipicephalus sanguineus TaxID=34632 RepID=A0A9D4PIH3_RHISA|nr:hypothetical protein HPB52_011737 [Rhipicephalus sanguineus]
MTATYFEAKEVRVPTVAEGRWAALVARQTVSPAQVRGEAEVFGDLKDEGGAGQTGEALVVEPAEKDSASDLLAVPTAECGLTLGADEETHQPPSPSVVFVSGATPECVSGKPSERDDRDRDSAPRERKRLQLKPRSVHVEANTEAAAMSKVLQIKEDEGARLTSNCHGRWNAQLVLILRYSQTAGFCFSLRLFVTVVLVPKPARSSSPRHSTMDQLRTKRGFIRTAITKALSTLDALLADSTTPAGRLQEILDLIVVKYAQLVHFDSEIQAALHDDELEADLTTAYEYEEKVSYAQTRVRRATAPRPPTPPASVPVTASPTIRSSADVTKLRNLYDETAFRINALEGLGVSPGEYCTVLRRILLKALPPDLSILYRHRQKEALLAENADASQGAHSQQVKDLMNFIRVQIEIREESGLEEAPSITATITTPTIRCGFINRSSTPIFAPLPAECSERITPEDKRRRFPVDKLCFRCAKRNHFANDCRTSRFLQCHQCAGRHLTSLCDINNVRNRSQRAGNASAPQDRASGSATTPSRATSVSTSGAGLTPRVAVTLRSQHSSYQATIEALAIPEISPVTSPPADGELVTMMTRQGMLPADARPEATTFQEDEISVLIGSDIYWDVATGQITRLSPQITAAETLFGWTIQGTLSNLSQGSRTRATSLFIAVEEATESDNALEDDGRCPTPVLTTEEVVPEAECVVNLAQQQALLKVTDYSRYSRLLRVTPWIYLFIDNAATRRASTIGPLNAQEIARAEHYWIRQVQHSHFPDDLAALSAGKSSTAVNLRRRVLHRQALKGHLWKRWRKEYLLLLQSAHEAAPKTPPRLQVGDIVLVHDDSPPLMWKMARVTEVLPTSHEHVQSRKFTSSKQAARHKFVGRGNVLQIKEDEGARLTSNCHGRWNAQLVLILRYSQTAGLPSLHLKSHRLFSAERNPLTRLSESGSPKDDQVRRSCVASASGRSRRSSVHVCKANRETLQPADHIQRPDSGGSGPTEGPKSTTFAQLPQTLSRQRLAPGPHHLDKRSPAHSLRDVTETLPDEEGRYRTWRS